MWPVNKDGKQTADFLEELYGEEEQLSDCEIRDELDGPVYNSGSGSSPAAAPAFSSVTSPSRCRERSRSPLRPRHLSYSPLPLEVVLRTYDAEGRPLDREDDREDDRDRDDCEDSVDDDFLTPDAHVTFFPTETDMLLGESSSRGRERSRRRGVRSVRGRGRGVRGRGRPRGRRGSGGQQRSLVGHPLNEIWINDNDVPPELVSLATDIMRRREKKAQNVVRDEQNRRVRSRTERGDESESEEEDEFADASDGRDTLLEGQNLHFEWASMESFQGKEEDFRPERTGAVRCHFSAYDAFRSYWDEDILSHIVTETNRYASKISSKSFHSDWYPTNCHEVLCLFAFWIMLGIVRMPTIHSCFSVDPLLKTDVFRRIFTRMRYEHLTRALNFVDSDSCNDSNQSNTGGAVSSDRLHSLRPILDHLNLKFKSNYVLQKDICIDESLTLWKGSLDFKQYIRSKASKYGVKMFELCESATGYLWSFIVYTGKNTTPAPDPAQGSTVLKSTAVVKQLIGPLLHKGYRLFIDDWYNSPHLARFLKLNGTDCVGTLRPTRSDVPPVINMAPLKRGEVVARHSGDVCVLSWQDDKRITMISTCHGSSAALPRVPSRTLSRTVPFKPQVVLDYNKFMGGVNLKDQMLEPYLLERNRGIKWCMKLFKRLLNVSILNSRILLQSSTQHHYDHLSFRLHLVDSILTEHLSQCPQSRSFHASSSRSAHLQPDRIRNHSHWPVRLGQSESSAVGNRTARKRCIVCVHAKRERKTTFKCEACDVPLCVENCFKFYHSNSSVQ